MTSTSRHRPIVRALFLGQNGRKIDDPRTKREIKRSSFILNQKDPRSHRETCSLRSKRMRFVAPFPRFGRSVFLSCTGRDDKISQRKTSHSYTLPYEARARTKQQQEKKERGRVYTTRGAHESYLVCKSDFAPERCRCQRRGCHRDDVLFKVRREESSSHLRKDFFFRGPESTQRGKKQRKRRSFFSLCTEEEKTFLKEDEQKLFCIFFTRICNDIFRTIKPLFLLGQKDRLFVVCSVCVCVYK